MSVFKEASVPVKVTFSLKHIQNGWAAHIAKPQKEQKVPPKVAPPLPPLLPLQPLKPDITISLSQETNFECSSVTICFDGNTVKMKSVFPGETQPIVVPLAGYDQNNRQVVEYDKDNDRIYVALNGMNDIFKAKRFSYDFLSDSITFWDNHQIVMEMKPAFTIGDPKIMYIKGWICESYLEYLPYLCGLLGYVYLN